MDENCIKHPGTSNVNQNAFSFSPGGSYMTTPAHMNAQNVFPMFTSTHNSYTFVKFHHLTIQNWLCQSPITVITISVSMSSYLCCVSDQSFLIKKGPYYCPLICWLISGWQIENLLQSAKNIKFGRNHLSAGQWLQIQGQSNAGVVKNKQKIMFYID